MKAHALVPELVDMASQPDVSTVDLLRRALVVARRLDVPDLVDWIDSELNGYKAGDVPGYRVLRGQLKALNPYRGPIPLILPSAAATERYTRADVRQSASELVQLSKSKTGVWVNFAPSVEHSLMASMEMPMRPFISLSTEQVVGIVEKVRNRILEWALDLERRGIRGDGMTFTSEEKQNVHQRHYHFGDVTGSQIQIDSGGSTQAQATMSADVDALRGLVEALVGAVEHSNLADAVASELRAELATLKAQAASPKPKWEVIRATARSIKAIAEGAAGNILATLAQPHLATLLALAG